MTFENINWGNFYQAYTGLQFSIKDKNCKIFVPNYKNISNNKIGGGSVTEMQFKDEWSRTSFIAAGTTSTIDNVALRQLWEYAESNVLWDEFNEVLSFKDIEVDEIKLEEFIKDVDSFLVYNKLNKFGNVWWIGSVTSDFTEENSNYNNVNIRDYDNSSYTSYKFWSPDKYLNDELKKYNSNAANYNGPVSSQDFTTSGWFTIPEMKISTKPFEKLKIAQLFLNLNYVFDPAYFGEYHTLNSTLAARIKDLTSNTVFDQNVIGSGQNSAFYSDNIIANWIGGLVSTNNLTTLGELGEYNRDACNDEAEPTVTEISHALAGQVSLNLEYSLLNRQELKTIDPIHWKSSESASNAHNIGILNVDRSFGGGSGDIDGGLVIGGIRTQPNINTDINEPSIIGSIEVWEANKFLKNIDATLNTGRCFHTQGGQQSKTGIVVGGFSKFNTDDYNQYAEYGKSGVLDNMEVFIRSDDPIQSYFKSVPTFKLNVGRGDAAGAFTVSMKDRLDKFQASDEISRFDIDKNAEQTLNEFIATNSETDNFVRYSVINIKGAIFGGNSTGNSYLTTQAGSDLLDSFERINTVFLDAGKSDSDALINKTEYGATECRELIHGVVTIIGDDSAGKTVSLNKCGRYKITYLNGAINSGPTVLQETFQTTKHISHWVTARNKLTFSGKGGKGGKQFIKDVGKSVGNGINSAVGGLAGGINGAAALVGIKGIPGLDTISQLLATGILALICPPLILLPVGLGTLIAIHQIPNIFGSGVINKTGVREKIIAGKFTSTMRVYLNEQLLPDKAFVTKPLGNAKEVSLFFDDPINSNVKEYIFCNPYTDSTLKLIFDDYEFSDNSGVVNVSVCYIGDTDECPLCTLKSEDANTTNVGITYSKLIPSLRYPVPVHGNCYVGNEDKGISTGGRCELSSISEAESQLIRKYKTGYKVAFDVDTAYADLIKPRVLDLVYENNGDTWVRKQNLIESVYYHCGVGDESNAIFWGGLHDCLSNFTFSHDEKLEDEADPVFENWGCSDSRELKTDIVTYYGKENYTSNTVNSDCAITPETWATDSVITGAANVYSNPEYYSVNDPSKFIMNLAKDVDFPDMDIIGLYPQSPVVCVSSQGLLNSFTVTNPSENDLYIFTDNITASNDFKIKAQSKAISGAGGIVYGNMRITGLQLDFESVGLVYPPDISGASVSGGFENRFKTQESKELRLLEFRSANDTFDIPYIYQHFFYYTSDLVGGQASTLPATSTERTSAYYLTSTGCISFNSIDDVFNASITGGWLECTSNLLLASTNVSTTGAKYLKGTGAAKFEFTDDDGILIGIRNSTNNWNSSLEKCGDDRFDSLNLDIKMTDDFSRWGTPLWSKIFAKGSVDLQSNYKFDVRTEYASGNTGQIHNEVSFVNIQTDSLLALMSSRVLISGSTKENNHLYQAMNNITLNTVESECQSFSGNEYVDIKITSLSSSNCAIISLSGADFSYPPLPISGSYMISNIGTNCGIIMNDGYYISGGGSDGSYIQDVNSYYIGCVSSPQYNIGCATLTSERCGVIVADTVYESPGPTNGGWILSGAPYYIGCKRSYKDIIRGTSYTEWASSMVQEYNRNAPFDVPSNWISANGINLTPKLTGNTFKHSAWKKYMDGVGLGGDDAPDYDRIYDYKNKRVNPSSEWGTMGTWFLGQMAFGNASRAVIVGGHKVAKSVGETGVGAGLHSGTTTKRTFIWDKAAISPEDSFSTNYLGRRFSTFFKENDDSHTKNASIKSNFGCFIMNAESDIVVERRGTTVFDGSSSSVSVVFDEPLSDSVGTTYSIMLTPSDNIKLWWSDKSITGFTLNSEINSWRGSVDWTITAIIKTTEEDISNKSDLSGYIF